MHLGLTALLSKLTFFGHFPDNEIFVKMPDIEFSCLSIFKILELLEKIIEFWGEIFEN